MMPAHRDYSSHDGTQGHRLEIDRRNNVLQIGLSDRLGSHIWAEFSEAEAEEIASAIARVCRNVRTFQNVDND